MYVQVSSHPWGIRLSTGSFQKSSARVFVACGGTWLCLYHWQVYAEVGGLLEAVRCPLHILLESCLRLSSLGLTMPVGKVLCIQRCLGNCSCGYRGCVSGWWEDM